MSREEKPVRLCLDLHRFFDVDRTYCGFRNYWQHMNEARKEARYEP